MSEYMEKYSVSRLIGEMCIRDRYENGGSNAWYNLMLDSNDLSELLNKAEYTQKMYDYDRQSLEKYVNTIDQVTKLGNQYQQEKAELEEIGRAHV